MQMPNTGKQNTTTHQIYIS